MADIARARQLRRAETWAEKLVWRWLRERRFSGYKFRRQHPLGDYYLDFFCEAAALNLELDGGQHGFPEQRRHDAEREKFLQSRGIKTLRFWNGDLRRNAQAIRDTIFNELQARAPHPLPEYTRPMRAPRKKMTQEAGGPPASARGPRVLPIGVLRIPDRCLADSAFFPTAPVAADHNLSPPSSIEDIEAQSPAAILKGV